MRRKGSHMLQLNHIKKEYKTGDLGQKALDDVSLNPVSYTHLDVYKRQVQGGTFYNEPFQMRAARLHYRRYRPAPRSCGPALPGWMRG